MARRQSCRVRSAPFPPEGPTPQRRGAPDTPRHTLEAEPSSPVSLVSLVRLRRRPDLTCSGPLIQSLGWQAAPRSGGRSSGVEMIPSPCPPGSPSGADERGLVAVLTAVLLVVLFASLALAVNHAYSLVLQRELRVATDSAAHAATVSLCATKECWEDAKAAALNTLA